MFLEWQFKQIRFKQQKKLNKTNLYLYKSIASYIQNGELSGNEIEEILQQVMDMMLQAQIENKPMNLIIGNNYEEFCKSIMEEYNRDKSQMYKALNYIQKGLSSMLLISVFLVILRGILNSSFNLGIPVNYIIAASVISLVMIPSIKKSNQEKGCSIFGYQRLYSMNRGLSETGAYGFVIMIFTVVLISFILLKAFGTKVFNYTITLYSCIPYVVLMLMIIGIIEVYKRMYNKR